MYTGEERREERGRRKGIIRGNINRRRWRRIKEEWLFFKNFFRTPYVMAEVQDKFSLEHFAGHDT